MKQFRDNEVLPLYQRRGHQHRRRHRGQLLLLTIVAAVILVLWHETRKTSALEQGTVPNEHATAVGRGGRYATTAPRVKGVRHLIVVAGHAVLRSLREKGDSFEENAAWHLERYQEVVPNQASTFVQHARMGVAAAAKDPEALLLFSGGATKLLSPLTEAQSYWLVSEANMWFAGTRPSETDLHVPDNPGSKVGQNQAAQSVRERSFTENFARDSFENVLFSICRFHELTGRYPDRITVVSYEFKRRRFEDLHRKAMRIPAPRFAFTGSGFPREALEKAVAGEAKVFEAFEQDPYGMHGILRSKVTSRDPFNQGAGHYANSCEEIQGLMQHEGPAPYVGRLPWVEDAGDTDISFEG